VTTTAAPLDLLADQLDGELALPGTDRYAELAMPWNVSVPVAPAAVVAATSARDVAVAVRAATAAGLRVAVQATGHGALATGGDVLLVVTRGLDECVVHPEGWARVGAGVKWQRVLDACLPHGLAPLSGSSLDVGVVGYTTGGGLGPMARTYGLASDAVRAFEVVTGDGVLRRVTPDVEPDLFWALRGGKGSVGIVTAVEIDLFRVADPYAGALYFDGSDTGTVLHAWRTWAATLPESVTTSLAVLQLPPMPGVPPVLAGRMTVAVRFLHVGDAETGAALLAPMRAAAPVLLDGVGVLPLAAIDMVHSDPVDPMPSYERGFLLRELPAEAADAFVAAAGPGSSSSLIVLELRHLGGAFARGGTHPSAFCHRDQQFALLAVGIGVPPLVDAAQASAAAVTDALAPWCDGKTMPNFTAGPSAYDAPTLARLIAVAEHYDPHHVLTDGAARLGRA
jgi:FAD/FMN-containing dehydrogenase